MTTSPSEWAATARLLRRAGFGARGSDVDAAVALGRQAWLTAALAADPEKDPGAVATPLPALEPIARAGKGASREDRAKVNQQYAQQRAGSEAWWVRRMVAVHNPVGEKLTFGWHNHFATDIHKVRDARLMLAQNTLLRREGRGSFTTLAKAVVTDPAMMKFLDAQKSTRASPNENLAREFMELFALGHSDGYTEQDVREGARALTGWTIDDDGTAQLVARRHDDTSKTFLGRTGDLGTDEYVDTVLAQAGSPTFVVTRWWQQLVSPAAPPASSLQRAVGAYGSGRDLRAMFASILADGEMQTQTGSMVVSPVEWLVGAARALAVPMDDDKSVKRMLASLRAMGQVPFEPPSVAGWPSGQAWLSTASAQTRLTTATRLAQAADLGAVSTGSTTEKLDAVTHLLGIATLSDRSAVALRTVASTPAKLVAAALVSPEYLVN